MKRNIPRPHTPKQNFLAAATHVIPLVSLFGEKLISRITGGEIVSHTEEFCEVADVFDWKTQTSFQVKMCNHRHAQRPTARQIDRLHAETKRTNKPFVAEIRQGLYALVFYDGVRHGKAGNGKSKLLSRKKSGGEKLEIIAREIQYIYLIEVDLLYHISRSGAFADIQKFGGCKVHAERKVSHYRDRLVLYLTRSLLAGFVGQVPKRLRKALSRSFGTGGWCIEKKLTQVEFKNVLSFRRAVPVIFIGRPGTRDTIRIRSKVTFDLGILK